MFFRIPVTSLRSRVTHRNAFCAFCNYDLDEVVFWEVAVVGSRREHKLRPPAFISANFDRYMRQCSQLPLIGDCPVETNSTVTRSCWAFYAPVIEEASGSTYYKNAYCARCHGANLTATSCLPPEKTTTTLRVEVKVSISLPDLDLSSIFRTVDRNSTCFSSYNGVCYIQQVTYRYANASTSNPNTAILIRGYLTIVCISVSLICLVLKLVVYLMSKEYRLVSGLVNSLLMDCVSIVFIGLQGVFLFFGFRDHRHVSQMVSSSSSLVSGLLTYSRSRSSTTATTDVTLGVHIPTIHGSSHDRRTSDDVASA
ncbi:hypothetical protein HPB51_013703 [Rhipicephalus microplus]|uniref:Uncharacterized protein n=1 Tax=Rhipicephalus microplus TaxID=6941 RepID=A0A9J6F308_RHIMP|nr:hypothetical protein HPB51_013703 [Rhipicephalus microplus]